MTHTDEQAHEMIDAAQAKAAELGVGFNREVAERAFGVGPRVVDMSTEDLRAELAHLNDLRADDARRTAICQELTLRMIARELPADWSIWHDERCGWAVTRDHGSLVVGVGYRTLAQAFDVARRTLADDASEIGREEIYRGGPSIDHGGR